MSYPQTRSLWIKYFDPSLGIMEVTLVIENGIVKKRSLGFERVYGVESHLDLSSLGIAIPGAIDLHEHLRGLELEYKEDEVSGSLAAARGGFTAVIDMPNTKPEVRSVSVAMEKLARLKRSVVDYGLLVGLPEDVEELREMLSLKGVVGLKLYPRDLERFGTEFAKAVRNLDALLMVHAEHPMLIRECCEAGRRWICRPIEAEIAFLAAIRSIVPRGTRLHVTHVTNVATLSYAKSIGATVDTCPHYILLTSEDEARLGCLAKVNPPLRPREVVQELANSLSSVDALATDHAPHSVEEKASDFCECPSGIASNEIAIALTLDLVSKGLLLLDDIIRLWSLGPARILKLRRWGCIDVGCIASYTIIDLKKETVVDPSSFITKAKLSPYAGRVLRGAVVATIARGRIVFLEDDFFETCCGSPIVAKY